MAHHHTSSYMGHRTQHYRDESKQGLDSAGVLLDPCAHRACNVHTFGYCLLPRCRMPDFSLQNWVLHGCCGCRTAIQLLVDHWLPPFSKFPFPKFPFFLLHGAFCWLSAAVRGEGFFAHKGRGETTPWHSKGLRECGGDFTESKPLSVRLVPSRLGTTLHCAGEGFYASGQGIFPYFCTTRYT